VSTIEKLSEVAQVKGLLRSKPRLLLGIGGSVFGAFGVVKDVRKARDEQDTLKLVNAVVGALALVTSTALLIRELRQHTSDDVLRG